MLEGLDILERILIIPVVIDVGWKTDVVVEPRGVVRLCSSGASASSKHVSSNSKLSPSNLGSSSRTTGWEGRGIGACLSDKL